MSSVSFAALLCSRLCHDLVSPVGALSNGVEILADETDAAIREQVLSLLEQSARQTSNRLQFFRLAFGAGGGFGASVDPREGHKALQAFLDGTKVDLVWQVGVGSLPKDALKLLLNLALIAAEGLVRGGTVRVTIHTSSGGTVIEVMAEGERFLFSDAARSALSGQSREDELEPRTAPAHLASIVARELPAAIEIDPADANKMTFRAILR